MPPARSILPAHRVPLPLVFFMVGAQLAVLWLLLRYALDPLSSLETATRGWVDVNLPLGLLLFLLAVVPIVFVWAGLRPRDIGLDSSKLRVGIVVVALLWSTTQAGLAIAALVNGEDVRLAFEWTAGLAGNAGAAGAAGVSGPFAANGARDAGHALGFLIAMLVVIPLGEEAVYRGFVLPQLWLRLAGEPGTGRLRARGVGEPATDASAAWRARIGLWTAIAGSSLLFALAHLPVRLSRVTLRGGRP